jgi:uncharacterized protein
MIRLLFAALSISLLSACAGEEVLVSAPRVEAVERVASRFASVEVMQVSLPSHASDEVVYVEGEDGALVASDLLWADDPTRAITLALSRNLTEITGARIAPEPWPFDGFPAARVDVRVERFLTTEGGTLTLSGQYFVADLDGQNRDRARLFSLSAPLGPEATVMSASTARGQLVADLALLIARDGLR